MQQVLGGFLFGSTSGGDGSTDAPWRTFEDYGAVGDGTTDDTAALTAALAIRQPILVSAKTFKITSAITEKFTGRIVRGVDAVYSVIKQTTAAADGVVWANDPLPDPENGNIGCFRGCWENLSIVGPGAYDNSTNSFSGSTGSGLNVVHVDEYLFANIHIRQFLVNWKLNGPGSTVLQHCSGRMGGTGLLMQGGGVNSNTTVGFVSDNNAIFNVDIAGGQNVKLGLADCNVSTFGSTTAVRVQSGAQVWIQGANFEQCTPGGNVVNCALGSNVLIQACRFVRGASSDNTAVLNDGSVISIGTGFDAYTTPYSRPGSLMDLGNFILSIPGGGAGGGISSGSPGIRIGNMFVRSDQIESNDLAFFNQNTDLLLLKAGGDVEALVNGKGFVVQSPNATRYRVTVDNTGALVTTSL